MRQPPPPSSTANEAWSGSNVAIAYRSVTRATSSRVRVPASAAATSLRLCNCSVTWVVSAATVSTPTICPALSRTGE